MKNNSRDTNDSLRGHLLVAMPGLADPNFSHSVIYVCEHSSEGAMGLVINQPLELPLSRVFAQLDLTCPNGLSEQPLLLGGPVEQQRGFILHCATEQQWQSTVPVTQQISLTASRDIIEALAANQGPESSLMVLGYAGWGPGQLEQELQENAWLTTPAEPAFLFDIPYSDRAAAAAARLGIDINLLSTRAGHA